MRAVSAVAGVRGREALVGRVVQAGQGQVVLAVAGEVLAVLVQVVCVAEGARVVQ